MTLMEMLEQLVSEGQLRQLDYQFARFIYHKSGDGLNLEQREALGFIAAIVSNELAKGHICLSFLEIYIDKPHENAHEQHWDLITAKLGLTKRHELTHLMHQKLLSIHWVELFEKSSIVGEKDESVPLIFDLNRLYLHRYWLYEVKLADHLLSFESVASLKPTVTQKLREVLDILFARDYEFVFNLLKKKKDISNSIVDKQWVCDCFDVINDEHLDWVAIGQILNNAQSADDLKPLETAIPLFACLNWQKVAAAVALTHRFTVISGGPGTGKTTTVAKLLAALILQAKQNDETPSIKLVAPTGKAAARLAESIGVAVNALNIDSAIKEAIPAESSTIHRLLGAIPNSAEFRHHSRNLLHVDILIVDEASMVDLPMMVKLIDALPQQTRLILLGDKDQLASVEAGAVLGDICSFLSDGYSKKQVQQLIELTGYESLTSEMSKQNSIISDSLCMLQKSYRFDSYSGVGQLAKAVNLGLPKEAENVFKRGYSDITYYPLMDVTLTSDTNALFANQYKSVLLNTLIAEYGNYLRPLNDEHCQSDDQKAQMDKAKLALSCFNQCRLLCALHKGPFGVNAWNQQIEKALHDNKLITLSAEIWYHGRPIMVTRNNYDLELYNGDIGLCMYDPESKSLKVYFELTDGSIKAILPTRVPEHETAYAMTIHKSQGSEFGLTLLILPPDFNAILTRELIYTGITRAKNQLMLFGDITLFKRAIEKKTERSSGLRDRLKSFER